MKAPYLNPIQTNKPMLNSFAGINRGERIDYAVNQTTVGEWAEAENLTTEQYPVAMTRDRRSKWEYYGVTVVGEDPERVPLAVGDVHDAVSVADTIYVASSTSAGDAKLVTKIESGEAHTVIETYGIPSQIVDFGGGVFTIDGTYIPFQNEQGKQYARIPRSEYTNVTVELCPPDDPFNDLAFYDMIHSATEPANPENGDYWNDTVHRSLYRWDGTTEKWSLVLGTMIRITGRIDFSSLNVGDSVQFYSEAPFMLDGTYKIKAKKKRVINEHDYWSVWVDGICEQSAQSFPIRYERRYPNFDYICSHKNRIWGCRYGLNDKNEFVNELYASALGRPLIYFEFGDGTADESWMASVGTGGPWTGVVSVEDSIFFFKEDRIFMVNGTEPSNFSYKEIEAPGIGPGQSRSAIVKDGAIFYAAKRGIYKVSPYGYPVCISDKLRFPIEAPAIGIADKNKLRWITPIRVYVYDLDIGTWMIESQIEDAIPVKALSFDGYPVVLCEEIDEIVPVLKYASAYTFGDESIYLPAKGHEWFWQKKKEGAVGWDAETGLKGLGDPEPKRVKNIKIRLKTEEDTDFRVFIKLDEDETWIPVADEKRAKAGTYLVRYVPDRRCDLYRLRFEGKGHTVIYSITEEYENAGDVSVGL